MATPTHTEGTVRMASGPARWSRAPLSPVVFYGCFVGLAALGLARISKRHLAWAREYPIFYLRAWLAAGLAAIVFSAVILWLDRYEREPKRLLLVALLWGALAAPAVLWTTSDVLHNLQRNRVGKELTIFMLGYREDQDAEVPKDLVNGVVNATLRAVRVTQIGPFLEEFSKSAVVFLIFLLLPHEFDGVLDGLIYGALVGLGFAMAENIQYLYRAQAGAPDAVAAARAYSETVRGRIFFHGLTGHAMYTGLAGAGLGLARIARRERVRWIGPPLGFALAVVAHMTWNSLPEKDPLMRLIHISGPVLIVSLAILILTWRRERVAMKYLPKVGQTPYTMPEIMLHRLRRWRAQWEAFQKYGLEGLRAAASLQRILIEWAYVRWHWEKGHLAEGVDPDQTEHQYSLQTEALASVLTA